MTVNTQTIEQDVREAIGKYLKKPSSEIKLDQKIREQLGVDSFGMFELTFDLQEKYNLEIPQEDFPKLITVEDIVEWISKHATKGKR